MRKCYRAITISLMSCLIFFLLSGKARSTLLENPLQGFRVFVDKQCAICHPLPFSESQQQKIGPPLTRRGPPQSLTQIVAAMWNHAAEMQEKMELLNVPRVTMTAAEMEELLIFIYFLNYFDEPGDPAVGKIVFREKGCIHCHVVGGAREERRMPLDQLAKYASPIQIARVMWNHPLSEGERVEVLESQWPRFQGDEVNNLAAYIWSASKGVRSKVFLLPPNPKQGEKVFTVKGCDTCHTVAPGVEQKPGPNLATRSLHRSASQIAAALWTHRLTMLNAMEELGLERPTFSEQEMADLLAYLYFLSYTEKGGNPVRGEALFVVKGCSTCHSVEGKGGQSAPDLAQGKKVHSWIDIAQAMWNHAPVMTKRLAEQHLSFPTFQGEEMADLLAYLKTLEERP